VDQCKSVKGSIASETIEQDTVAQSHLTHEIFGFVIPNAASALAEDVHKLCIMLHVHTLPKP
jgi:hypothetical protein